MEIIVIRQHKQGNFTFGDFELDRWCVGVKDTFWQFNIEPENMNEYIDHTKKLRHNS